MTSTVDLRGGRVRVFNEVGDATTLKIRPVDWDDVPVWDPSTVTWSVLGDLAGKAVAAAITDGGEPWVEFSVTGNDSTLLGEGKFKFQIKDSNNWSLLSDSLFIQKEAT